MKALVKYQTGEGNMEIRDIPEPVAGQGQVKIEVKAAGICGSDLHIYHEDIAIPLKPPVVTGHEFSGVIAEVGEGVTDCNVGDKVVVEPRCTFCGTCEYCMRGLENLCPHGRALGYWYNGAFTKYTVAPAARLHKLPEDVDLVAFALTEPLACVVHGVLELTHITVGDVVLVTGPGAIGLLAMQVAKAHGATLIVAGTARDVGRLKLAEKLGADKIVNVTQQNVVDEVNAFTDSRGVDIVFECSGNAQAVNDGLLAIRKRGQFTQIGLFGKQINLDFEKVCYKELKVTGSFASRRISWEKALQLAIQNKVRLRPLVSDVLPITEWEKAFKMFEEKQGLKLVLTPVND